MDTLERYLAYETWTMRHIISRCGELSREQLHQPFDIGQRTAHDTIIHIIGNLEDWTDSMRELPRLRRLPPPQNNVQSYLERFDAAMVDFADCTQGIVAGNRLDETYEMDTPPVFKTFGGTILHVLTHTTVHRWELQHILQRLGITDLIEGDALTWDTRIRPSAG